jgi:SDR family mycofactocin-dependent oxidoreductase
MGRVDGKVVLITGAGRGQGRSHALKLAAEGADIIALDVSTNIDSVAYDMARPEGLEETVRGVEALGRRVFAHEADVRNYAELESAIGAGVAALGGLHVVVANAGIVSYGAAGELPEQTWQDMIDINLTGVWHTVKASLPRIADGSSIILTSSTAGLRGIAYTAHYTAAKHGVVGLMRTLTQEVSSRFIRVNTIHPGVANTPMIHNQATYRLFRPDLENPTADDFVGPATALNLMPIPAVESEDVSNAVLFLASDESRYVTGATLPVDAGASVR